MIELSKIGEKLLDEIIETNADVNHWDEYFDNMLSKLVEERYINEQTLRSAFGELKENELINVFWADGKPWNLELTSKGRSYVKVKKRNRIDWLKANIVAIIALMLSIINTIHDIVN